jgi:hypothetical protein
MPNYIMTVKIIDSYNGYTNKRYLGEFADAATAEAAAAALIVDLQAASDSAVVERLLSSKTTYATSPVAGSNVFMQVQGSVTKSGGGTTSIFIPTPKSTMMSGNSLIVGSALWADYMANFAAGEWTISDGESYVATIKGDRVNVPSGKTNLP